MTNTLRTELIQSFLAEDVKKLWHELLERKKELDKKQERIDDLIMDAFEQVHVLGCMQNSFIDSLEQEIHINLMMQTR